MYWTLIQQPVKSPAMEKPLVYQMERLWSMTTENSLAAFLGPVFLTYLADQVFHFQLSEMSAADGANLPAAEKFGKALFVTVCTPWLAAFVVYSILHWTVPRDLARLALQEEHAREDLQTQAMKPKTTGSTISGYLVTRNTLMNI